MRYAYKDLGERSAGTTITLELEGSAANILLLDPFHYSLYRRGRAFRYHGGLFHSSPATLTIPRDGRWYLVVDLGGHGGRVRARIQKISPPADESTGSAAEREEEALEPVA